MTRILAVLALLWPILALAQPTPGPGIPTPTGTLQGVAEFVWNGAAWVAAPLSGVYANATGAKCDGVTRTDITTTSASAVISSTGYTFIGADVGKYITIAGAGTAGAVLNATIASVSAGNATLSKTAGTSIAGTATATWGTDDSAAFNAEVAALSTAGGGTLNFTGKCIIASSITWKTGVSLNGWGVGKSVLKWISPTDMTASVIQGISTVYTAPYTDNEFTNFEMDIEAGTEAVYDVAGKGFFFQFMRRPLFSNLYVHGSPATCIGVDYLQAGRIVNNTTQNCGRLAVGGTNPLGGAGIGIGTSSSTYSDGVVISGNTVYSPTTVDGTYGIFVESQNGTSIKSWNVISNNIIYLQNNYQYGIGNGGVFSTLIANNTINGVRGTSERGISIDLGTVTTTSNDPYGKAIGNIINGVDIGIYYNGTGASQVVGPYTFENNSISNNVRYGIYLHSGASVVLDGIVINGGAIYSNDSAGIFLDGTAGFKNLTINNVKLFGNAQTIATVTLQAGIAIATPVARLSMFGNDIYDGGSTKQKYAIIINNAAVTAAKIDSSLANNLAANATGTISLAGTGSCAGTCGP